MTSFGVTGDGVTDNGDALIALRDTLTTDRQYVLFFPPGHYKYSNNRWLWGVKNVVIEANGVQFENISTSGWHANTRPFNTHSIFDEDGDVPEQAPKTFQSGQTFASALPGETTVDLLEPHTFAVGNRVLLLGYDQQGSAFPPNARYFQWNEVAFVNGNAVTLQDPLVHEFRDDWPDTELTIDGGTLFIGKARMLSLDRPNFRYAERIEIQGAEFLPNTGPNSMILGADTLVMKNVAAPSVVPTENRIAEYTDCTFADAEPDKICDKATFVNCTLSGKIKEGTGINILTFEDCAITSDDIQIAPRSLFMRRNRIVTNNEYGAVKSREAWPTDRLVFENNTITHRGLLRHAINDGLGQEFTPVAQGQAMAVPVSMAQNVIIGSLLYAKDLSDGGRITDITYDGTNLLLHGTWLSPPAGTWVFYAIQNIQENGTIFVGGERDRTRNSRLPQLESPLVLLDNFKFSDEVDRRSLLGAVTKIKATVISPYTGPDTSSALRVRLDGVEYLNLAWDVVGTQEVDVPGVMTSELAIWFNKLSGGPIAEPYPAVSVEVFATRIA